MNETDLCDEEEKQFLRDLEAAKTLSLATFAEQQKGRKGVVGSSQAQKSIAFVQPLKGKEHYPENRAGPEPEVTGVEVRVRPRPSPVFTPRQSAGHSGKLLPPPLSLRDEACSSRNCDLIQLSSPTKDKSPVLETVEKYSLPVPAQRLHTPLRDSLSIFSERPFVLQLQQYHFSPVLVDPSRTVQLQQHHFSLQSSHIASPQDAPSTSPGEEFPTEVIQPQAVAPKQEKKLNKEWGSSDLIHLDEPSTSGKNSSRNSLWEMFDPLYENTEVCYSNPVDAVQPDDTPYELLDPFEYMCIDKKKNERCPSIYESLTLEKRQSVNGNVYTLPRKSDVAKKQQLGLTSPVNSAGKMESKTENGVYRISIEGALPGSRDSDLETFIRMVKSLRSEFSADDYFTNPGMVISPTIESSYLQSTSLKLIVSVPSRSHPVLFTCAGNSSIVHIITYLLCEMLAESPSSVKELDPSSPTLPISDYILKVWGLSEYLTSDSCLQDYEYVRQCINTDEDVKLVLMHIDDMKRNLAREATDDLADCELVVEDFVPNDSAFSTSYEDVLYLIETIRQEGEKLLASPSPQSMKLSQSVKALCSFLLGVEIAEISDAVKDLSATCLLVSKEPLTSGPSIVSDDGPYSIVQLQAQRSSSGTYRLQTAVSTVMKAVQSFLESFARSFDVSFSAKIPTQSQASRTVLDVVDTVMAHVVAVHRLDQRWRYDNYVLRLHLYHGTSPVSHPVCSKQAQIEKVMFGRLTLDEWMDVSISYCTLPREARLVFVLVGRKIVTEEQKNSSVKMGDWIEEEIGWTAVQCFDSNWELRQGKFLLPLWPMVADRHVGPAPSLGVHPQGDYFTVLELGLPDFSSVISFPDAVPTEIEARDFGLLDVDTQMQLMDTVQSCTFTRLPTPDREVLWEKRHYLSKEPRALPKVLLSVRSWDHENLSEIYGMLKIWRPLSPVDAIELLLPCFPDVEIRRAAVNWLQGISSDELVDLLPQILQALKFEAVEASPLARFLLERSLTSPRVAHSLYWLLVQELPGDMPHNSDLNAECETTVGFQSRHFRRYQILLRVLVTICGNALRNRFMGQQLFVRNLCDVAKTVKNSKDSGRSAVLQRELDPIHYYLSDRPSSLPLSLGHEVSGMDLAACSYFTSFTVPLKLVFKTSESDVGRFAAIFKVGDDLRQDMITLQMIRLMDKIWLREGLDLKMVVFKCVATGHRRGMVEIVSEAETLRKIQADVGGLTGPFKDRCIQQWLMKRNPDALDYHKALYNFTASCAGYSVATYILGICDRHNDNIMIRSSGHLFHIDFGKFLGDSQMFGSFKRDRTPFVLTSDMAYVINGGDKPSSRFQQFIELCCQAFNAVRKHSLLFINLFALMASSGIPGVTIEAVNYISGVLMPDLTDAEASSVFARMIRESLKSWFTPVNFFIHSLGQLRFSDVGEEGALLSFIPKNYSEVTDGKLKFAEIVHYQKRYDPDKYYLYVIRVERYDQREPTYLFRSYEEFYEFHHKLCLRFPLAKLPSLPRGVYLGRSSVKAVADKRAHDLDKFLASLMQLAEEISHSTIVYTFFHPILRDQEEASTTALKYKEPKEEFLPSRTLRGDIKLSLYYSRGELHVMVMHVRDLNGIGNQQETTPSSYVKVYLLPDSQKHTKRKTRVVKRNANPTFMEMLVYRLPLDVVRTKTLQASVWNHDRVTENEFLGAANIPLDSVDLSVEIANWYSLTNNYSASRLI